MSDKKPNVTGAEAVEPPNFFTPTPNAFFDTMLPAISTAAELKVTLAIIRQTCGWTDKDGNRKAEDQLSVSRLMTLTGLSRQAVMDGLKAGLERGTILRRLVGAQDYKYRLNIASPVKTLDQSKKLTGLKPRPVPVKNLDRSPVYTLGPQNKEERKEKKMEGASAPAAPPSPSDTAESKRKLSEHPAVQIYREVHRRYPSGKASGDEPSEQQKIVDAVGDKPEDVEIWKSAVTDWRDLALAHNQNLTNGQRRWNPSGVDSAIKQFSEMLAERVFEQKQRAVLQKQAAAPADRRGTRTITIDGQTVTLRA